MKRTRMMAALMMGMLGLGLGACDVKAQGMTDDDPLPNCPPGWSRNPSPLGYPCQPLFGQPPQGFGSGGGATAPDRLPTPQPIPNATPEASPRVAPSPGTAATPRTAPKPNIATPKSAQAPKSAPGKAQIPKSQAQSPKGKDNGAIAPERFLGISPGNGAPANGAKTPAPAKRPPANKAPAGKPSDPDES